MITVRPATLADLPAMLVLGERLYRASDQAAALPWNGVIARRTLRDALLDRDSQIFLAHRAGSPDPCGILIGQLSASPWSAGVLASDLAFAAEAGGDRLLRAYLRWCRQRGARWVDLGVSQRGRPEAKTRLLRRVGFTPAGGMYHLNLCAPATCRQEAAA